MLNIRPILATILLAVGLFGSSSVVSKAQNAEIIGGVESPKGTWPFQIALLRSSVSNNFDAQFCGGTLVNTRYILTAAHCVTQDDGSLVSADSIDILVGTQDLAVGGRRIRASKIVRHPNYNPDTTDFDVAVIKLSKAVTNIKPVKIITPAQANTIGKPGATAVAVGWGNTSTTGQSFPEKLRHVKLPIQSLAKCNGPLSYKGTLTKRMLCAGFFAGGKDSCQGDSGGPLLVRNSLGKFAIQTGVVSWGNACAAPKFPGIYARLSLLGTWVKQEIVKP